MWARLFSTNHRKPALYLTMRANPYRSKFDPEMEPAPSWLADCLDGKAEAIAAMFKEHLHTVERVLFRLVGPTPDLPDLVQTVFAETIRSLPRYRGEASFKTWLTKIAVYTAQHHLRAGRVRRLVPLEAVPSERLGVHQQDIDRDIDERRLSVRLHSLLDQISPKNRVALLLFGVEGRSAAEVAALMGASEVATRSRVFLARRELRALIEADEELSAMADALLNRRARREQT